MAFWRVVGELEKIPKARESHSGSDFLVVGYNGQQTNEELRVIGSHLTKKKGKIVPVTNKALSAFRKV